VSAFDELSREELIEIILRQQGQIAAKEELIASLQQTIIIFEARIAELERQLAGKGGPPPWVKPNAALRNKKAKEQEKKERKKRSESFVRRRETPTEVVYHAVSECPDCGRALHGGWEHARRQVIEVPQMRVRVIEHVVLARSCGVCRKTCLPERDFSEQVVGQSRLGVGLMSLIGSLRADCRLPIRQIRSLLQILYGVSISTGEITAVLQRIAQRGQAFCQQLRDQVRGSPFVHADETGWREDGQNGYLWSFSTPTLRYFLYDRSRAGLVAREVLGEAFEGVVVSDFYGGYNAISGKNQRCWVHLLRDLHKLRQTHPCDTSVGEWVDRIVSLYREATGYQAQCRQKPRVHNVLVRREHRRRFEGDLSWLAVPYLEDKSDPRCVLAQRLDRYASELFVFIEHPDVPSQNNAAERAIRPAVIARKISGGSRSAKGSETMATLLSLFGTWRLQGKDPWQACRQMLAQKTIPEPAA